MELKIGHITTRELASWFGITYDRFLHTAEYRYRELKKYCKYEKLRGYILIKEVYNPVYAKPSLVQQDIENYTLTHWRVGEPETATRIADQFLKENPWVELKLETVAVYVRNARTKFWGSPKTLEKGQNGGCRYIMAKMDKGLTPATNTYQLLSQQEKETFHKIYDKYYKTNPEEVITALDKRNKKLWDSETALDYIFNGKQNKYREFIQELSEELGCDWIVNATYAKNGCYYIRVEEDGKIFYKEIQIAEAEP